MKLKRLIIILICTLVIIAGAVIAVKTSSNAHDAPDKDSQSDQNTVLPDVSLPFDANLSDFTSLSPDDSQPAESAQAEPIYTEPIQTEPVITEPIATAGPDESDLPTVEQPKIPDSPIVPENATARICLGGDTSIDSEFADAANKWGVNYPWKEVSEIFGSADISVVNLETCVSERGQSEKRKGYGFRTPPAMLEGFVSAGIDMVNLANNHTRDFGYDALLDTFEHLSSYGIDYFGAGKDKDEASGLIVKDVNGIKIGFAGCNYVYLADDCAADVDHAGINMVYKLSDSRTEAFLNKVKEYDAMCDVLIVFMHAGTEEVFEVNSYQKRLAKALIDNGTDIVVGAHPHTLQPIEFYNGKPIFYSIGNLIFWHIDDDIDGLTAIFDITIDKNGFKSLKLHPLFIKNYKVYLLKDGEGKHSTRYRQIMNLMNDLCLDYGIGFDENAELKVLTEGEIEQARLMN